MKESLVCVSRILGRLSRALTTSSNMGILSLILLSSAFRSVPKSSQDLCILVTFHPVDFPGRRWECDSAGSSGLSS